MHKEVDKHSCKFCDSEYKLVYDPDNSSGLPKFCPFCGEETYSEELDEFLENDME